MASYSSDLGLLYPSEAGFKGPGRYGEFLQAQGSQRAAYLAEMDQFFASLDEQQRQFNETLGFKNKELASRETLTRESYDLQRELQDEQIEFERWKTEEYLGLEERKLNMSGMNYLGGPTSREIWSAMQKNKENETNLVASRFGTKSEPRFQTVDPTTGKLVAAGAGDLYSQVTNYGQGGSGVLDSDFIETYKNEY